MFDSQDVLLEAGEPYHCVPPVQDDSVDYRPGCSFTLIYGVPPADGEDAEESPDRVYMGGELRQTYPIVSGGDWPANDLDPGEWPWIVAATGGWVHFLWQGLPESAN